MLRSPVDVLRLVVATGALLAVLLVEALFGAAVVGFAYDLLRGIDALGSEVVSSIVAVVRLACLALLVAGLVAALVTAQWRLLVTALLGAAAGALVSTVSTGIVDAEEPPLVVLDEVLGPLTSEGAPTTSGLAVVAAVVTAAGPWLPRRARRLAWALVVALAASRFVAAPLSGSALVAVLSGWVGGALAVVVLGAPSRRPTTEAVIGGLRSVGTDLSSLEPAAVDARGSTPYFGATPGGRRLFVKVLGQDERGADLLFRLYRYAVPRDRGDERPFSTLRRAVEHEALLSLAAAHLGVRTPPVAAFADVSPNSFVVAFEAIDGRSLDRVDVDEVSDAVLTGVWQQLAILHEHRVAHRDLRLANLFLDGRGEVWMIDLGFAELAASDLLLETDVAELLASLSSKVGAARAVEAGARVLGRHELQRALPRLRRRYLSGATRQAAAGQPGLLPAIEAAIRDGVTGASATRDVLSR